ncbi:hypothetical protein L208DRAFT_823633 [Tricholoma matsutake]|nr:hypothetical protein L208DRAFT_823633 [Tricholoma matsutake 945]
MLHGFGSNSHSRTRLNDAAPPCSLVPLPSYVKRSSFPLHISCSPSRGRRPARSSACLYFPDTFWFSVWTWLPVTACFFVLVIMMPALSNFISYRPKRKNKPLRTPFQIRQNASFSPHPYASPPIIDINDGGALETTGRALNGVPDTDAKEVQESPQMILNLEFNDEPLGNLFPLNFLKSDSPFRMSYQPTESSVTQDGNVERSLVFSGNGRKIRQKENSSVEEADEEDEASSSEVVLAKLVAMDATAFITENYDNHPKPPPSSSRKLPPAPIRIPSYGHQTQNARSRDPSRPTSQVSSPESSAISGTTLARALMANTFVLSGDSRASRYRSGVSLARADSATLPRGEFTLLHSPYWRERTNSGGELTLSPSTPPPVPPVPDNAELVYVPPKAVRHASETRSKRNDSVPRSTQSERASDSRTSSLPGNGDAQASRRISRISEQDTSLPPQPQDPVVGPRSHDHDIPTEEAQKDIVDSSSGLSLPVLDPIEPLEPLSPRLSSFDKRESGIPSEASPVTSEPPSSARDIMSVLDYYAQDANLSDQAIQGFRPVFSPITEETSSQLSPSSPYRRDPKKTPTTGRSYLGSTPSPFTAGVHVQWTLHQHRGFESRTSQNSRDGTSKPLLPIGERPRSIQGSLSSGPGSTSSLPSNPSTTPSLTALAASDSEGELTPPPIRTIFNRQRSGSTPSPIQVIRDVHDDKTYNITVTTVSEDAQAATPSTGDDDSRQTFPETPSAFSPVFTPASVPSPGMAPQTPMSASILQKAGNIQTSLAQQVLLTRAATSVHGARPHTRQSLARMYRLTEQPKTTAASSLVEEPPEDESTNTVVSTGPSESTDVHINTASKSLTEREKPGVESAASVDVMPATPVGEQPTIEETRLNQQSPEISNVSSSQQPTTSLEQVILVPPSTPFGPRTPPSSRSLGSGSSASSESPMESTDSLNTRLKGLPRIPPSPKMLPTPPRQGRSAGPTADMTPSVSLSDTSSSTVSRPIARERSPPHRPDPNDPVLFPNQVTIPVAGSSEAQAQSVFAQPQILTFVPSEPQSSPAYSLRHTSSASIGSPPPYHTVVSSAGEDSTSSPSGMTPSTSGSYDPNHNRLQFSHSASPHSVEFSNGDTALPSGQSSPGHSQPRGARARPSRPPLPAGPRRPSQTSSAVPLSALRSRGGSVSSINSNFPTSSSRRLNASASAVPSIKFQTPAIKWKGFPLDAARWTFTSAQLQAIVSRAIKQSAEPSSIRLLRLETLDDEVPPEIERLETQRNDAMARYKTLALRRANLLEALSIHVEGSEEGFGVALRLVEDLKDVSASLDKLTEELHMADGQLAQLSQLCLTHSGSALALALRKLNTSFLKQFAEVQVLRSQVESLEAERDEAWKQAEDVAMDYEELRCGILDNVHPENRFGRVLACRKSSIRASKAGLRQSSAPYSRRSSVSSNRAFGTHTPPSSRTPNFSEDIPPVPPMPRRRPSYIKTDIPIRNSVGLSMSTTSGLTPNTETRALVRAQEDLYELLGITMDDTHPRRPRSVGAMPEQTLQIPSSMNSQADLPISARRASLPGSIQPDVYNPLTNVSIMLTADRAGWI